MRRFLLILTALLWLTQFVSAQAVDSIKVEQAGDLIKIHYKILNSNSYQSFRVSVFCSINGGLKSELRSLSGDFGENVVGGRTDYMVLWDVLKDVDEVKSVDFSVKAELIKDNTPESLKNSSDKFSYWKKPMLFVIPSIGGGHGMNFGIRMAYMGNWGVSAKILIGSEENGPYAPAENVFHTGIDLTKRVFSAGPMSFHLMAGINYGKLLVDGGGTAGYFENFATYELGALIAVKWLTFYYSFAPYNPELENGHELYRKYFDFFGIGVRFKL